MRNICTKPKPQKHKIKSEQEAIEYGKKITEQINKDYSKRHDLGYLFFKELKKYFIRYKKREKHTSKEVFKILCQIPHVSKLLKTNAAHTFGRSFLKDGGEYDYKAQKLRELNKSKELVKELIPILKSTPNPKIEIVSKSKNGICYKELNVKNKTKTLMSRKYIRCSKKRIQRALSCAKAHQSNELILELIKCKNTNLQCSLGNIFPPQKPPTSCGIPIKLLDKKGEVIKSDDRKRIALSILLADPGMKHIRVKLNS